MTGTNEEGDNGPPSSLADYLSQSLEERADEVTELWLAELSDRLKLRPNRLLPTEDLRDHIPTVIRAVATLIQSPRDRISNRIRDHLRNLAQMRREQGFDIQELLVEFDLLSRMVWQELVAKLEDYGGTAEPAEVLLVAGRLRSALSEIESISVATFRDEQLQQTEELASRLAEFGQILSHELIEPLSSAAAGVHALGDSEMMIGDGEREDYAEMVLDRLERVRDLVTDIRMLALAEGSRAEERWMSLLSLVERTLDELGEQAERRGVRIEVEGDVSDFEVDASCVEIPLVNLISNGIKYADPGKEDPWVRVSVRKVEDDSEREWSIDVEDNGLGIPEAMSERIFTRLFRGHPEVSSGTGLGLSIARQVVHQRGGRLRFESDEGEGSRFMMELPRALAMKGEAGVKPRE